MDTTIKERSCHRFLLYITVLILRRLFLVYVYGNSVISYFTVIVLGDDVMKSILNASAYVN